MQKSLPELAKRMVELKKTKPDEEQLYKRLSEPKWWEKNVEPNYALSKSDQKNLAAVGREFEGSAGSTILFFTLSDSAADKETAEKDLATSINFMRTASTYWALRSLIRTIDASVSNTEAQLLKAIGSGEIEIEYLLQKAQGYESLRKRYPNGASDNTRQIVEVKEGGAKYLPLDTQLVAVNAEILSLRESVTRMRDKLTQDALTKEFLQQALPNLEKGADGLVLGNDLLEIISRLRAKLAPKDRLLLQALNELESDISSIVLRFDKGLQVSVAPKASMSSNPLKSGTLGLFFGVALMLIFIMIRRAWPRLKKTA